MPLAAVRLDLFSHEPRLSAIAILSHPLSDIWQTYRTDWTVRQYIGHWNKTGENQQYVTADIKYLILDIAECLSVVISPMASKWSGKVTYSVVFVHLPTGGGVPIPLCAIQWYLMPGLPYPMIYQTCHFPGVLLTGCPCARLQPWPLCVPPSRNYHGVGKREAVHLIRKGILLTFKYSN